MYQFYTLAKTKINSFHKEGFFFFNTVCAVLITLNIVLLFIKIIS